MRCEHITANEPPLWNLHDLIFTLTNGKYQVVKVSPGARALGKLFGQCKVPKCSGSASARVVESA